MSAVTLLSRDEGRDEPVRVWCLRLERDAARLTAWRAALPAEEQARAASFRQPDDAARWVQSRTRLRRILAARLRCAPETVGLVAGRYGKPMLPASCPPWQFNLSHSGDWLMLALAWRRQVGIDIESWRELEFTELAKRAFAPAERRALEAAPPDQLEATFYAIWTRKEALLKARGLGLGACPLDDFAVEASPWARPRVRHWRGEVDAADIWRLYPLPAMERYSACLVVEHQVHERDVSLKWEKDCPEPG